MKKLYIHMGVHRTGTTHLQRVLRLNENALLAQKVLYPKLGKKSENHSHIAWGLIDGLLNVHQLVERIALEQTPEIETIILSHEDFSLMRDFSWLSKIAEHYDVNVCLYLRRQELWLESWYNQHIKWPWDAKFSGCTPEYFLRHMHEFYWIDYRKLLDTISREIGKSNLYVNVIDGLGVKDSTQDFLSRLKLQCEIPPEFQDSNASLSTARLDVLRRVNLIYMNGKDARKNRILEVLKTLPIAEDDGSKIVFNDAQVRYILGKFSASNQSVARDYFSREVLFGDDIRFNRSPRFVSEYRAYRVYIPELLREVARA